MEYEIILIIVIAVTAVASIAPWMPAFFVLRIRKFRNRYQFSAVVSFVTSLILSLIFVKIVGIENINGLVESNCFYFLAFITLVNTVVFCVKASILYIRATGY